MSEGSGKLWSREWWFSVVLIGVAIHLLASYLKPRVDQVARRVSLWWATRNQARSVERAKRICSLHLSPETRMRAEFAVVGAHLSGISNLLLASMFLGLLVLFRYESEFATWLQMLCAALAISYAIFSLTAYARAGRIHSEIREGSRTFKASQEASTASAVPGEGADDVAREHVEVEAPNPEPQPDRNRTSHGSAG